MKIKTKKVMTEKEYLHYVIDKTDFLSISHDFTHIDHDIVHSDIVLELHDHNNVTYANTWVDSEGETVFEVDIEEEITEDTKLPSVLVYDGKYFKALYGLSINDIEKSFIDYVYRAETIHLIDGDTHTLIWRDGKLI